MERTRMTTTTTKEKAAAEAARADRLRADMWSATLLSELASCPHVLTDESLVAALEAATSMQTLDRRKTVGPIRAELMARLNGTRSR